MLLNGHYFFGDLEQEMVADPNRSRSEASTSFYEHSESRHRPVPKNPSLADISRYLSDARTYSIKYIGAQAARVKAIARNVVLLSILGLAAAIAGLTILICSTVLLCSGISGAISQLFGGRLWVGDLITGVLVLGSILITAFVIVRKMMKSARRATIASYERQKV